MKIRKFCACGVKLERDVSDEETARKVVTAFWTEHAGVHHFPINEHEYARVISRIIARNAAPKRPKGFSPMLSPKMRFRIIKGGRE